MEGRQKKSAVALIAGVTGIVGVSLARKLSNRGGPWNKIYGIARRPRPTWFDGCDCAAVQYIQCDLLDAAQTQRHVAALKDTTHLFFVTWTSCATEEENIRANVSMLRNTLDALLPHARGLAHVCLQTGTKHYLGSHYTWAARFHGHVDLLTFSEDTPRLPERNFYYAQEDLLLHVAATSARSLTWTVHRAGLIVGVSPNAILNTPLAVAAYACICKHGGLPFVFPWSRSSWEGHVEASDADLIAEQEIWAVESADPACRNQAYNIANGDSVTWQELWPAIAESFGVKAAPYTGEQMSLVEMMQDKRHVWEELVLMHSLHPTRWQDLVVGWWCLDLVLTQLPSYRMSMAKSAKFGFHGSCNTKASFLNSFEEMRNMHLLP